MVQKDGCAAPADIEHEIDADDISWRGLRQGVVEPHHRHAAPLAEHLEQRQVARQILEQLHLAPGVLRQAVVQTVDVLPVQLRQPIVDPALCGELGDVGFLVWKTKLRSGSDVLECRSGILASCPVAQVEGGVESEDDVIPALRIVLVVGSPDVDPGPVGRAGVEHRLGFRAMRRLPEIREWQPALEKRLQRTLAGNEKSA